MMQASAYPIVDNLLFSEIRPSTIHGDGLFATNNIIANSILGVLDGQLVPWDEQFSTAFEWNAISESQLLIRPLRTKYSYINHSRSPNLQLEYHPLRVTALKGIKADEELTLDYRKEPLPKTYQQGHGSGYL
jgi:hypothetical protein